MGTLLFETIIDETNLPDPVIRNEFTSLLEKHGKNPDTMTLEDLREVLASYLQEVFLEVKEVGSRTIRSS